MHALKLITTAICVLVIANVVPASLADLWNEKVIFSYGSINYSRTWLHTDSRYIKDGYGTDVVLKGAGYSILEWGWGNPDYYMNGNFNSELFDVFKQAGGNSIRFALTMYTIDQSYLNLVDTVIGWCRERNIYVILDMHFGNPDNWTEDVMLQILENPTIALPKYPLSWIDWLEFYADRYKDDPLVCGINIFNEPCQNIPAGYTREAFFNLWRNDALMAAQAIHSINPNLLVFVWGMFWGETLEDWSNNPLDEPNIVYCFTRHMEFDGSEQYYNYYVTGDYERGRQEFIELCARNDIFTMLDLGYPIDLMEWGSQNPDYPNHEDAYLAWMEDALEILNESEIGFHYWDFSGYDPYDGCLLRHDDWLTLSTRGEIWAQYCRG
jgi:aryl-phospho-beta-D-glucosidase BglC (GH1 family)